MFRFTRIQSRICPGMLSQRRPLLGRCLSSVSNPKALSSDEIGLSMTKLSQGTPFPWKLVSLSERNGRVGSGDWGVGALQRYGTVPHLFLFFLFLSFVGRRERRHHKDF